MRPIALLSVILFAATALPATAREVYSPIPLEIERTALRADEVESRQRHKSEKPSARKVSESKSNSFTFSTGAHDYKFKFNGGFDGRGFKFHMDPGPKEVLRKLWFS